VGYDGLLGKTCFGQFRTTCSLMDDEEKRDKNKEKAKRKRKGKGRICVATK